MSYQALLFCQDEKTARTVTQVLSELEFQVDPCSETFAAVKKLTTQAFEAVVVDCQNEENASLLLKTARNSASNQSALMVALVEGQAGVAAAFRIGANLVLTKPIAIEQARGTLRVARGLLRKNATAAPSIASAVTSPASPIVGKAPQSIPVPPAPVTKAPAITPPPTPKPIAPVVAPTRIPAAAVPASRPVAPQFLAAARVAPSAPVPPSALRATGASSNLVTESELQPQPDAASAGLFEAIDFKEFVAAPASSFPASASEIVSVSEINSGAHEAVRAALTPRAPISSRDFAAGFGAAVAPAKESFKPAPPAPPEMPKEVADLFEAPVFGQSSAPARPAAETVLYEPAPHASTHEPELDFTGSPAPSRSKMPLVAVAVIALAAAGYFGWSQIHKPTTPTAPAAGPLQPPPPDFGAADAASQSAPPPTHAAQSAPAEDTAQPAPEPVNRFARQNHAIAEDRVTTPIAVVPSAATPSQQRLIPGRTPIEVKAELQHPQAPPQESAEAPAIANLGATDKPDALNAIAHSTPTLPGISTQRISQGVSDGLLIKRVQPVYPQQAQQMHIEGMVSLQATIAKDGSIRNVKVLSGPAILVRSASDAVRQWKYKPYTLNGEPVEVQTDISINFVTPK